MESHLSITPINSKKPRKTQKNNDNTEKKIILSSLLGKMIRDKKERNKQKTIKLKSQMVHESPIKHSPHKTDLNCIQPMLQMQQFKKDGISVLENLHENELEKMISVANDAYYNTNQTILSDNEFDILKEYIEKKYPKNKVIQQIGAPISGKNKVKLPYFLGSMDKIKPDTGALNNWTKKYSGPYVLSCKLDGVSGMYSTENPSPKLYTRGDGEIGQDISHLLGKFRLPEIKEKIVVRGEFILPKRIFEEKYKTVFANPRNLVSGIVNSKTPDNKTGDLHFVAYEVISPAMKPSDQMKKLAELGFEVVRNQQLPELSNEILSTILLDWRGKYEYEIDGVIVANDDVYPRQSKNPENAFAFKMVISDQIAEAKVVDVIWTASKNGYLKPRVQIEPVRIGGVTIEFATGFNGKFIETNKIGIGSLIQLTRSGDVIPFIVSVIISSDHAKMPSVPYHWTESHVDIILDNFENDETVILKNITDFFKGIEVDGLSEGNIKRIVSAGFDTIPKILQMNRSDFANVEGFKDKLTEKIFKGIHNKVHDASLVQIMAASNLFGRGIGTRKLKLIFDVEPELLVDTNRQNIETLTKINGIGKENAKIVLQNIPRFMAFLKECNLESKLYGEKNPPNDNMSKKLENIVIGEPLAENDPLFGKHIVMTKTRDTTVIDGLKRRGAIITDNVKTNTFAVIVKSYEDESNKTKKAKELGIPILIPADFIAQYF